MRFRPVWLTCLVVVAALAAPGVGAAGLSEDHADTAPPDPATDVLGWENGVWHNESINVDQSDGLDDAELEAVLARSMARVEYIRRSEFDEPPEITFLTREEYGDLTDDLFDASGTATADRLHQNTKFEALGLVGEDTDYFAVRRQNQASFAAAFYVNTEIPETDLSEGDLGIVLDGGSPQVREPNLGHELVHALQNQRFDRLDYGDTEDSTRAANSVIEGDASYVDTVYERRCGDQWDCLDPSEESKSESPEFANLGLVVYDLFVYGEGPDFVDQVVARRGWDGVDALYDRPPATTEQVIHPRRYPEELPRNVTVADRSTAEWEVPDTGGGIDYATFGEAGLFVLLWYPGYDGGRTVVMSPNAVFTENDANPYNFSHPASEGWEGDKLYPYVNASSAATNETGYVWKTAWESAADAREFADAYRDVLAFRGGERVGRHTWRIPDGGGFGDAIHLDVESDTVTVVNAPTVAALTEIHAGVTVRNTTTNPGDTSTTSTTPGVPGFTLAAAVAALLVALLARRW